MSSKGVSPLVLGTVQLGLPYGIANTTGQPDQARATDIVRSAWAGGIREFDTAQDYGVSETVLGRAFAELGISKAAKVISKIDPELNPCDAQGMAKAIEASLKRLGVNSLWGLMIHKEETLSLWSGGLEKVLRRLTAEGKVRQLGVSVYSPERALEALELEGIDMVQVPSNLFDRRFEKAKIFERAAEKNKQIYIRSVFLQGLILMDPDMLPGHMLFAKSELEKIALLAKQLHMTRSELALGYLKQRAPGAKLLIGAETSHQVKENLSVWAKEPGTDLIPWVSKYFPQVDEKILNPSMWRKQV